jgi:hypothetical protein
MFALPEYDGVESRKKKTKKKKKGATKKQAGRAKSKVQSAGAGSGQINVSMPTVPFMESPLPKSSSIQHIQSGAAGDRDGDNGLDSLPDWDEAAADSPSSSPVEMSSSPSSDDSFTPNNLHRVSRVRKGARGKGASKKKKGQARSLSKKKSPSYRVSKHSESTKKKLSAASQKRKVRSRPGKVQSGGKPIRSKKKSGAKGSGGSSSERELNYEQKLQSGASSNEEGSSSISLSALAASKTDEWYDGSPQHANDPLPDPDSRHRAHHHGMQPTRMHQQKHRPDSNHTKINVHRHEMGPAEQPRTVTIHRTGSVEITTADSAPVTERQPRATEMRSEAKEGALQGVQETKEDVEDENDSYEVLHNFWQKRRKILSNLDSKFLDTQKTWGKPKLSEADKWRKDIIGIEAPKWSEVPRPISSPGKGGLAIENEDVGAYLDRVIRKRVWGNERGGYNAPVREEKQDVILLSENKRLKSELSLQQAKFSALEEEWKNTLAYNMASPQRKSKSRTSTPQSKKFASLAVEPRNSLELEQAATSWLRWLRECINSRAETMSRSKKRSYDVDNTFTKMYGQLKGRHESESKVPQFDVSSLSDASSVTSDDNHTNNVRGSSPPPPLPPALQESSIGPEASALERACVAMMGAMESRENLRREMYRKAVKRSRNTATRTRQEVELQYNHVLDKLKEEQERKTRKLRAELEEAQERVKVAEADADERHIKKANEYEDIIRELKDQFKNVKALARHDAEYEIYRQRTEIERDHRLKVESLKKEVELLQKENTLFREREANVDVASLKERLENAEKGCKEATEQAQQCMTHSKNLEENFNQRVAAIKEDGRNASIRLREEHGIRMNSMQSVHKNQLEALQAKIKSFKADQEIVIRRIQTEHSKRMMEAVKITRQEANRSIASSRAELEASNKSQVDQLRALHRVEVRRLQRQLRKATKGNPSQMDSSSDSGDGSLKDRSVNGGGGALNIVLDGIEPSGVDLMHLQASDISDKSSYGGSSGEESQTPVDKMSVPELKECIVRLRKMLKRAQQTVRKEQAARKDTEAKLAGACKQRDAAFRKVKAWGSAIKSGNMVDVSSSSDSSRMTDRLSSPKKKSRKGNRFNSSSRKNTPLRNKRSQTDQSVGNSTSEDEIIEAHDMDVTNNVFLSPRGTIEKRRQQQRQLQGSATDEGSDSIPRSSNEDEERPRSAIKVAREKKPAGNPVAKLEAYLANTE